MALCCHDLSFSYNSDEPVLRGITLSVDGGERVALVAPSGYGKTTLCRVLSGYLAPSSGCVEVDGSPLPKRGPRPVQLIWQQPELAFDPRLRIGRSLKEVSGFDSAFCDQLLGLFDADHSWLSRFPEELSGGELMRLCIVRSLLTRPSYLICDEMTAMLDAVTQAYIWKKLLGYAEGFHMGLLIVSHSPALLDRIATRIVDLTRCNARSFTSCS